MTERVPDVEGVFDEDYLHFFGEVLDGGCDAETDLIWQLLELEPGLEVLDLACGYGRIANRLAERGCKVTGLDAAPLFLDRARRDASARGVTVTYVEGDMRQLPWSQRFDRVINWFTSFGYFDDAGNRQVLAETARALVPGGRLLLEVINRDWLIRGFQPASVMESDGDLLVDQHRLDPLTGRIVTDRTILRGGRIRRIPYSVRMLTFTELRDWLVAAGFTDVGGYGEDSGPLTSESTRMLTVATR